MRSFLMIAIQITVIVTGLVYVFVASFINENNLKIREAARIALGKFII